MGGKQKTPMKKIVLGVILVLVIIVSMAGSPVLAAGENWLSGWSNRIQLTIDNSKIDSNLINFPTLLSFGKSSGVNSRDLSSVFDTLGNNSKKIAVTTSDGSTQCYVEIEKWDSVNKQAVLWVKVPSILTSSNTMLYLYFDVNHADNTPYVGETGSAPSRNVWDNNFKTILHLGENPGTTAGGYKDSTSNAHNGTAGSSSSIPTQTAGRIGDSQLFNGDYIQIPDSDDFSVSSTKQLTISFWLSPAAQNMSSSSYIHFIGKGTGSSYEWAFRIYNASYSDRPQSISIYHWNPAGGQGAGSRWDHSDILNGAWVYVTATFGGSHNNIALYGNGTLVDNDNYAGYNITPTNGSGALRLGTRDASSDWLNGRLDEFRISNAARSDAWIKASYYSEANQLVTFGTVETSNASQTTPTPTPPPTQGTAPPATSNPPPSAYIPPPVAAPAPAASSGGGVSTAGSNGTTCLGGYMTTPGKFDSDASIKSDDSLLAISIPKGTLGQSDNNIPIRYISATYMSLSQLPVAPKDGEVIGLPYFLGPEGATFNPAVSITVQYDQSKIPAGIDERNLVVANWDAAANQWVKLTSSVDADKNTVTANISHLSTYAVLGLYTPPTTATVAEPSPTIAPVFVASPSLTPSPTPEVIPHAATLVDSNPTPTPTQTPSPNLAAAIGTTGAPVNIPLIIGISGAVVVIIGFIAILFRRKNL
jgi:hypothetical protein